MLGNFAVGDFCQIMSDLAGDFGANPVGDCSPQIAERDRRSNNDEPVRIFFRARGPTCPPVGGRTLSRDPCGGLNGIDGRASRTVRAEASAFPVGYEIMRGGMIAREYEPFYAGKP